MKPLVDDALWALVAPVLPRERKMGRAGGRPAREQPAGLHRHPVRAPDRSPLATAPAGDGLWQRVDLLAPLPAVDAPVPVEAIARGAAAGVCKYTLIPAVHEQANPRRRRGQFVCTW